MNPQGLNYLLGFLGGFIAFILGVWLIRGGGIRILGRWLGGLHHGFGSALIVLGLSIVAYELLFVEGASGARNDAATPTYFRLIESSRTPDDKEAKKYLVSYFRVFVDRVDGRVLEDSALLGWASFELNMDQPIALPETGWVAWNPQASTEVFYRESPEATFRGKPRMEREIGIVDSTVSNGYTNRSRFSVPISLLRSRGGLDVGKDAPRFRRPIFHHFNNFAAVSRESGESGIKRFLILRPMFEGDRLEAVSFDDWRQGEEGLLKQALVQPTDLARNTDFSLSVNYGPGLPESLVGLGLFLATLGLGMLTFSRSLIPIAIWIMLGLPLTTFLVSRIQLTLRSDCLANSRNPAERAEAMESISGARYFQKAKCESLARLAVESTEKGVRIGSLLLLRDSAHYLPSEGAAFLGDMLSKETDTDIRALARPWIAGR